MEEVRVENISSVQYIELDLVVREKNGLVI